jgi:hypothetical protein
MTSLQGRMIKMPRHGEERNFRLETSDLSNDPLTQETGGSTDTRKTPAGSVVPAGEKWCNQCKEWVDYKGIFQFISCPKCGAPWRW